MRARAAVLCASQTPPWQCPEVATVDYVAAGERVPMCRNHGETAIRLSRTVCSIVGTLEVRK